MIKFLNDADGFSSLAFLFVAHQARVIKVRVQVENNTEEGITVCNISMCREKNTLRLLGNKINMTINIINQSTICTIKEGTYIIPRGIQNQVDKT